MRTGAMSAAGGCNDMDDVDQALTHHHAHPGSSAPHRCLFRHEFLGSHVRAEHLCGREPLEADRAGSSARTKSGRICLASVFSLRLWRSWPTHVQPVQLSQILERVALWAHDWGFRSLKP